MRSLPGSLVRRDAPAHRSGHV